MVLGLVFVFAFSMVVPYNMDEFIHYSTITCYAFPGNDIHGECDPFALRLLGTNMIVPLRAYYYVGSFPALYYYPLYLLWQSPLSARFLGFVFLVTSALITARIFRLPRLPVLLSFLLFFPFAFQHIVDTGPVGFQILAIFFLYGLSRRWCATAQWRYVLAMAGLIFLGLWTKLSFAWVLPGTLGFCCLHSIRASSPQLRRLAKQAAASGLALAALLGLMLFSPSAHHPDLHYIQAINTAGTYSLHEILSGTFFQSNALLALLNPLAATHAIYEVSPPTVASYVYAAFLYLSVPVMLLVLASLRTRRVALGTPLTLYCLFLITAVLIAFTKEARVMHHAVLAIPFLVLAICATIRCWADSADVAHHRTARVSLTSAGAAFMALNVYFFAIFSQQPLHAPQDPSKLAAHAILSDRALAQRYVTVAIDWGMYYYQGLYGPPEQSVLYSWGLREEGKLDQLKALAAASGRKLLFVHRRLDSYADLDQLAANVHVERCAALSEAAVWQIHAEPDPTFHNACNRLTDKTATAQQPLQHALQMASLVM